jgi:thiol-disulfide isomerase/thioredoxin
MRVSRLRRLFLLIVIHAAALGSAFAQDAAKTDSKDALSKTGTVASDKLISGPDDKAAYTAYIRKAREEIAQLALVDPDQAEALLLVFKARAEAGHSFTPGAAKDALASTVAMLEKLIRRGKKMRELIGKDAAPLEVEAWINGAPLTDADLKGRVVILVFWTVWSRPCVAILRSLEDWQAKHGERGLVIIALTRYCGYEWDAQKQSARRAATGMVTPEMEQQMLEKLAAHYKLQYRFAIQPKESRTAEYYSVTGIPHVVLIDRVGKVRFMRAGSGDETLNIIGDVLEKLLSAPATATKS